MRLRVFVASAAVLGTALACSPSTPQSGPAASSSPAAGSGSSMPVTPANRPVNPPEQPALACGDGTQLLATMSAREKLAQLLMVGVTGADDAAAVVADQRVGGIFVGNWTDKTMLTDGRLKGIVDSAGPLPLLVSVDEEGGRVSRLSSIIGSAPSARDLAASGNPDDAYQSALTRGRAMRGLGITVDFAPVVDVTDAPANTVIGDRSFSGDPAVVTEFAGAYARGLRDAGVLPVLKHFPGHGRADGDSHHGGVTTPPLEDLQASDLVPYRTLTSQGPVAVMVGHMEIPGLTGDVPASLSPAAYGLLRSGGYGGPPFGGVVFTDDLSSMGAINARYGVAESVLLSLQGGADIALWVTTDQVPAVLDRLEAALASGELSQAAVDASVLRVAAVKGRKPGC